MKNRFYLTTLSCLCLYLFACGDEDKSGILLPGPENVNTTTIDGVTYSIEKDYATVTGCDPLEEVIIRSEVEINGEKYTVKALGNEYYDEYGSNFRFPSSVQKIHIPTTIVRSGANVFSDSKIRELYLESLQSWCAIDFELTTHVRPGGTDEWMKANPINENTNIYVNGELIEELEIPSDVRKISYYAFYRYGIPVIKLSEGLDEIGTHAFAECGNLETIALPASLTKLGTETFENCGKLKKVEFSPNCKIIPEMCFAYTGLEDLEFPEGVEIIDRAAFVNCSNLRKVVLPATTKQIGRWVIGPDEPFFMGWGAFTNCDDLTEVYVQNPEPPRLIPPLFEVDGDSSGYVNFPTSMLENGTLYVPLESVDAYKADYNWGRFKNIVGMDFSGVESVSTDGVNNSQNSGLYDLNGHKVRDENPPHGIYIQNGKKIVR